MLCQNRYPIGIYPPGIQMEGMLMFLVPLKAEGWYWSPRHGCPPPRGWAGPAARNIQEPWLRIELLLQPHGNLKFIHIMSFSTHFIYCDVWLFYLEILGAGQTKMEIIRNHAHNLPKNSQIFLKYWPVMLAYLLSSRLIYLKDKSPHINFPFQLTSPGFAPSW